jgi:hypothetical protein
MLLVFNLDLIFTTTDSWEAPAVGFLNGTGGMPLFI